VTIDYKTYIESDTWKARRVAALKRSTRTTLKIGSYSSQKPCCEACGKPGLSHKNSRSKLDYRERQFRVDGSNGLEVHHLHYRTLGSETPDDLIVLCTDTIHWHDWNERYLNTRPTERHLLKPAGKRVGCHERTHDDASFRRYVENIAAERARV